MYGITNDYFDSFTAIFGPKECLLNGKRYPLGHFAVEALEMDRRLLRDLEKAAADFKPERLPDSVDDFTRNTFLMLVDYFENLPACSPSAYAEAYEKYRRMMNTALRFAAADDVIDEDLDSVQLSFPVRLGSRAMEAKDGSAVLGEELTFEELAGFLYTDLYKGMAAGSVPRRCHNKY